MTRRIKFFLLAAVVEEIDDADQPPPSVVPATGESISEPARPLAKALPSNVVPLRKVAG